jgi:FtsP/CotA-like multicopper oxidase with cupredoxin domain
MTRNQRIGLLAGAVVVAVAAFVIAKSGGDDNTSEPASSATNSGTRTQSTQAPKPEVTRISVKGGVLVGDAQTIDVKKNDVVRIVVSSDAPDQIHLHGYDIEKEATPGKPARFDFKADVEGAFIIESHAAEDAGNEPLLARLHVEP